VVYVEVWDACRTARRRRQGRKMGFGGLELELGLERRLRLGYSPSPSLKTFFLINSKFRRRKGDRETLRKISKQVSNIFSKT
jgi:hypothetical protein